MTDKTSIPVLKKAVSSLVKAGNTELNFSPNAMQSRIKARFYRRLEEMSHHIDRDTAFQSPDTMVELAGTDRIIKWLEDPAFSSWFVDDYYVIDTIASLQSSALRIVEDALVDPDASVGDKLKAARMLLELGDQFPGKKSELRFIDDRINEMTESETDREIKKLKATLQQINGDTDD